MDDRMEKMKIAAKLSRESIRYDWFKHLVKRRRCKNEIPSRKVAIKNHCWECMGWDSGGLSSVSANVKACTAKECWLYPWRNGPVEGDKDEC